MVGCLCGARVRELNQRKNRGESESEYAMVVVAIWSRGDRNSSCGVHYPVNGHKTYFVYIYLAAHIWSPTRIAVVLHDKPLTRGGCLRVIIYLVRRKTSCDIVGIKNNNRLAAHSGTK